MKPLKILFVEDLPTDVEIAQRVLKNHGLDFEARVVDTEPAYREALDNFCPDVIISDYAMPTFDGMRALEIALAHPVGFPFVMLTGSMNEETAVACLKAGANDYVIKEKILRLPFAVLEAIEKFTITAQKEQAEAEVRRNLKQLQALREIETALVSTLDLDKVLETILSAISRVIACDSFSIQILEGPALKLVACLGFAHPTEVVGLVFPLEPKFPNRLVIEEGKSLAFADVVQEYPHFETEADEYGSRHVRSWLGVPLIDHGAVVGMVTFDRETVTPFSEEEIELAEMFSAQAAIAINNARLFERAERRLQNLKALHEVDLVIAGSMDVQMVLDVLLDKVRQELSLDAASVLLYNPHLHQLDYAASRGMLTSAIQEAHLKLGYGLAGKAVLEKTYVQVPNLREAETNLPFSSEFITEGFVFYHAEPLIAKGQVKGVLELFQRSSLAVDSEWHDFVNALANQAAIAIENASLVTDLQNASLEISRAYDSTLEGWARALELKDAETTGHSLRVVDLSLQLAERLGFTGEKLSHIRRGALLHDIGKMAVPDSILQKPGPLSEEEWAMMRQHPRFAFDMLAPVSFLRQALDIPHYHHEKWDGSGYPDGLKGNQIPLAARIFAIVDVWDALCSDRPYREAWPEEKVYHYIQEQSGSHFDPQVVEAFLALIKDRLMDVG
jgi:putative nucleotidyltransferase with HDIG domain